MKEPKRPSHRDELAQIIGAGFFILVLGYLAMFGLVFLLGGCSSPKTYRQNVLGEAILYPHPGYPGLINRACLKYKSSVCTVWSTNTQDTSDPQVRENLQRLKVICDVGGKLYHPCSDRNGLCRNTYGSRPFLGIIGSRPKKVEFLSLEQGPDKDFLISARTTCRRFGLYEDPESVTP